MAYTGSEDDWPFPDMNKPSLFFQMRSRFFIPLIGSFTKFYFNCCVQKRVYNGETFFKLLRSDKKTPFITVSNHVSCLDDPLLFGILRWSEICSSQKLRWTLAAHDICFTNSFYSMFFSSGKCIPIIRGQGVFQRGMDFCLEQLKKGDWVHIFPEGKVNVNKDNIRLKWGVGRLIYECPTIPIVLPFYHVGMDDVLPNKLPYIPRIGKKVTIVFGEPIDLNQLVTDLRSKNEDATVARKAVTDVIQESLFNLREKAEELHRSRLEKV